MKSYQPLAFLLLFTTSTTFAATRIAVLDFELNDITSLPNTQTELQRTASMAPLLIQAINQPGKYQALAVASDVQKSANAGFGYLFRNPDEAVKLGQQQQVDLILVSQHSKPSFLFSYLWVYLLDVKTATTLARYDIELKGLHEKVTQHAIATLAKKIQQTLAAHGN